jgi:hypothetical protein
VCAPKDRQDFDTIGNEPLLGTALLYQRVATTHLKTVHTVSKIQRALVELHFVTSSACAVLSLNCCLVEFEVITAVVMKNTIFWVITSCNPVESKPRFGGIFRLHFRSRIISLARKQRENRWQVGLILLPCRHTRYVPLKRRLTFLTDCTVFCLRR